MKGQTRLLLVGMTVLLVSVLAAGCSHGSLTGLDRSESDVARTGLIQEVVVTAPRPAMVVKEVVVTGLGPCLQPEVVVVAERPENLAPGYSMELGLGPAQKPRENVN